MKIIKNVDKGKTEARRWWWLHQWYFRRGLVSVMVTMSVMVMVGDGDGRWWWWSVMVTGFQQKETDDGSEWNSTSVMEQNPNRTRLFCFHIDQPLRWWNSKFALIATTQKPLPRPDNPHLPPPILPKAQDRYSSVSCGPWLEDRTLHRVC